ncbi:hypothetical protein BRD56_09115 [Thermoplasmatales archaeon SW_10_69_26]|nr:MAG: hypothetical protein BRD56_09115 [Thermoplasmatales archaeon SW_10_69_26]
MSSRARRWLALAIALTLATPALAGCIGFDEAQTASVEEQGPETSPDEPTFARELPGEITGVEHELTLGPDEGLDSAYQIAVQGEMAYISAWNAGFYTVDISDPMQPEVLGHVADTFGHDPWVLNYDDGRTFVANAATSSGIDIINVTDPTNPEKVANVLGGDDGNVHNIAVVPGTHLIYNSRSVDTPGVDIVDASDPANPELVRTFNDLTCHDISFHMPDDRAYCAGVRETQIWEIADPERPEIVTRIANPAINIHHWAIPANDGDTLVIGDELAGAASDAANGCAGASAENPATGGTTTDPVGALWFYDVSEEQAPTPQSWISASEMRAETGSCTAHFGEIVGDRDKMVVGFLSGGTYTIDFADVTAPQVVDHDPVGEVVDVQVHHGWAFGVGRERGMDVWTFAG